MPPSKLEWENNLNAQSLEEIRNIRLRRLKRTIWLYLLLVIFEGALRKWVLPGFATPLLIVRDPIALFILFEAFRLRLIPSSPFVIASISIGIVAILCALAVGHGNPFVALYGARPLLFHFPAMFVMARILDRQDILLMGRFLLILTPLMSFMIALQFYSPQSALVNIGVGGEGSSGFSAALGYFRPSGTFSFTTGVAQFYSLVAAFVLYFWLRPGSVNRGLLLAATFALLAAIPFSVSRTLLFQALLTLLFAGAIALSNPQTLLRGVLATTVVIITAGLMSTMDIFQTSISVLEARFTLASYSEGGLEGTLVDRYLGGLLAAFTRAGEWPLFGLGIGMGTNVGAMLLSGDTGFLIAEGEWQVWVGELGILLGFLVILMRVVVTVFAALDAVKSIAGRDILPWMLLANAITLIPQGNWSQPTSLGFSIIAGALLLASLETSPVPLNKNALLNSYRLD